jgi:plastocyanin
VPPTRRLTPLLAPGLVAWALIGCGGGDEEDEAAPHPRAGIETVDGVAVGGGGRVSTVGKGASKISVRAAAEGLAYTTDHVTIEAGETLLHFENPQSTPHDLDLEDADGNPIADMERIGGGYADVPIRDLEPGEYVFYCSVPGHREAGMEGTVTVE